MITEDQLEQHALQWFQDPDQARQIPAGQTPRQGPKARGELKKNLNPRNKSLE